MESEATVSSTAKRRKRLPFSARARSVPFKRPFVRAILAAAVFYLLLLGAAAALYAFLTSQSRETGILLAALTLGTGLTWLVSLYFRKKASCPLCKGTPYLDNRAHYHAKAVRFFPFNHGTTNLLRSLVRQRFRCQFCGSPFDLLKKTARERARR